MSAAVTAEVLQLEQPEARPYSPLYLVGEPVSQSPLAIDPVARLIDADTVPELRFTRRRAGQEAAQILARNRQLLIDKKTEGVPLPVDTLGTARRVVETKRRFGPDSPQYREMFQGLALDCERLFAETLRKNTWEHFPETLQTLSPVTGEYIAHGIPTMDIVARGLSPMAEPEEVARRVNDFAQERVNHAIPRVRAIGRLGLRKTVSVVSIWECPDWATEAYQTDKKASHGGYVPAIDKLMINGLRFITSGNRFQEQVGLSGVYITHEVIMAVLEERGAIAEGQKLTKTELHGKQFIDQSNDGAIGFAKLLDKKASELSGKNIFMGEEVPLDHPKDYVSVAEEAEVRRRKLAPKPAQLAEYVISLEENGTDSHTAEALVNTLLKETLLEVVRQNPELAAVVFDEATAEGFAEIARLESADRNDEARELQAKVEKNAPEVSYCGAGSCGLERADPTSADTIKVKKLGLKGEILHDTERPCPECNKMTVFYDKKGNKACSGCEYRQVNGKTTRSSKK